MTDLRFTEKELAALFGELSPARVDVDSELAGLFGESTEATSSAPSSSPAGSPSVAIQSPLSVQAAVSTASHGDYAWLRALHLVPEHQQLICRYPAIGLRKHPQHGVVLMAAYLEDVGRRVRRNLKLGDDMFFYAEELELTEPDTKELGCRIIVKTLRHHVGMKIRFWQNGPEGDVLGKSGIYEVREAGLKWLQGAKGSNSAA